MSDIAIKYDPESMTFSWNVAAPGLAQDDGLETAVILSLFSDRRANADDVLPSGDDRRGWWADTYADVEGDRWGSRLWLLDRSKQMPDILRKAEEYAREALQWLIEDRIVLTVQCAAEVVRDGVMGLTVTITRGNKPAQAQYRFEIFWKGN
jgi:phage gp46-like protein